MSETDKEETVLTVRVNHSLLRELDEIASQSNRTRADLIREALTSLIGIYSAQKPISTRT